MIKPGKKNNICDVEGILVGNACDNKDVTGVTVVLPSKRVVAGVDVRGGAPGTREVELLKPENFVQEIDAIVLSGGSVFGLEAASAVTNWLSYNNKGIDFYKTKIPIVPSAIIFDFHINYERNWSIETPFKKLAFEACEKASTDTLLGNIGAGLGATAGTIKGGLGSASYTIDNEIIVGALAIANPAGSVLIPGSNKFWAGNLEYRDEFGGLGSANISDQEILSQQLISDGFNTTICVVATNYILDKAESTRVAIMAQDGIARAIRPVHTPKDGDVVFALSTCEKDSGIDRPVMIEQIGTLAGDCISRSIARAIYNAQTIGNYRGFQEL